MTRVEFFTLTTPIGEFWAGLVCIVFAVIWVRAAWLAPDPAQTRLRLWVVVFAFMFGFEEIVDSFYHEGDPDALLAHWLCTLGQVITATRALATTLHVEASQWRRSYKDGSDAS